VRGNVLCLFFSFFLSFLRFLFFLPFINGCVFLFTFVNISLRFYASWILICRRWRRRSSGHGCMGLLWRDEQGQE
jgi:hypothetical protein